MQSIDPRLCHNNVGFLCGTGQGYNFEHVSIISSGSEESRCCTFRMICGFEPGLLIRIATFECLSFSGCYTLVDI